MIYSFLDNKYLIDTSIKILSLTLTSIIGFKAINTIKKYEKMKLIDLEYKERENSIIYKKEKERELFNSIGKTFSLFIEFRDSYSSFEEDSDFNNLENKLAKLKSSQLEMNIAFHEISTFMSNELKEACMFYKLSISEYLYTYSEVLKHLRKNNKIPSDISLEDDEFKDLNFFYDEVSSVVFDRFYKIEEVKSN